MDGLMWRQMDGWMNGLQDGEMDNWIIGRQMGRWIDGEDQDG